MGEVKITPSTVRIEDYLLTIFKLEEAFGIAKLTHIAKILQLTPGAVNDELNRLQRDKIVRKIPYRGVKLTNKGLKLCTPVVRRHRIAELLVSEILEVPWKDAHNIVKLLEHGISDSLIPYIEKKLKNPRIGPHGNIIPRPNETLKFLADKSLTEFKSGSIVEIKRIVYEESPILEHLDALNIRPKNKYIVKSQNDKGVVITDFQDHDYFLSKEIAMFIKCVKLR